MHPAALGRVAAKRTNVGAVGRLHWVAEERTLRVAVAGYRLRAPTDHGHPFHRLSGSWYLGYD